MTLTTFFDEVEKNIKVNENDYKKDDILFCGFCNTPKQTIVRLAGKDYIMPCVCECERKREKQEQELKFKIKEQKRIERLKTGLAQEKYKSMTFANSDTEMKIAEDYVKKWEKAKTGNKGLLIIGDVGTGKTFMAGCIANELIEKGISVYMNNTTNLCNMSMFDEEREETLNKIKNCSLFILDDFGAERNTEYAQEQLYTIVETRYNSNMPMIVTTNISAKEFITTEISKARIYDRILENSIVVEMNGKSRRKETTKKASYDWELYKEKAKNLKYERK